MVSKILEIYENFSEIIYVSDVDTYQLIYMNKIARDLFGVKSVDEVKKHICYQLLQNSNSPCSMCTNSKIEKNCFYEWYYFNPVANATFSLKNTIIEDNGRRYRMGIAINITAQEKQKKALAAAMNNETLVNEALKYALAEQDPEKSIQVLMEYVGKALHGERSYIFEEKDGVCDNTYEWCAIGVTPQIHNLKNIPLSDLTMWYRQFKSNNLIIIDDMDKVKETDPPLYAILAPQGIHSLVVAPLFYRDKIIGFFGIDNPPADDVAYIYNVLVLLGQFLVSLINRRDLFNQLENLSFYDQLTGAYNRHALDRVLRTYRREKSVGIVYADVMGLKRVNDTYGHSTGDKMLIDAYMLLARYFDKGDVYRIGGDEFLVISFGCDEGSFFSQAANLRLLMEQGGVRMALGTVWYDKYFTKDLDRIIKEADELMYREKREIYLNCSEFDRRAR